MAIINGTGNDDTLIGGAANDTITGGLGNDLALMGGGNDVFVWGVGDGNDIVEGQGGIDTVRFVAGNTEMLDISANGPRARIHRDVNDVTVDLNDVERIDLLARDGGDTIQIASLSGTDVKLVAVDLAAAVGGADWAVDSVTQFGTSGNDKINVALANGRVAVTGLAAQVTIDHADAFDMLSILGGDGNDVINASKLPAGLMALTLRGGFGNDQITGSKGADTLAGDDGNDIIIGDDGNDTVDLGKGDDLFGWLTGDGNDLVDGSVGLDTVRFTDSNAGEQISLIGYNGHALIQHNASPQIDADNVERVELRALGGADHVFITGLAGTEVTHVVVDLAGTAGGTTADAAIDQVSVEGTASNDLFDVSWTGSAVRVSGLAAEVTIEHAAAKDILYISAGYGDDILNAAGLPAGKMSMLLNGGHGNDTIFGSAGNDTVYGGDGNDVAYLGASNDQFVWSGGEGDDKVEGQVGFDTVKLTTNGQGGPDTSVISANGEAARIGNIGGVVDINDVERIELTTIGGVGNINVQDLSGTDVKQVALDLGGYGTGGDQVFDIVSALGSAGNNQITVAMKNGNISVTGLPAQLTIADADSDDLLQINSGGGNDVINAVTLPGTSITLILNGGDGNDVVTGNAANNTLYGDFGSDTLLGGAGNDVMNGGFGDDRVDGGIGDDNLAGLHGDDVILGGLGDDVIAGGYGNDKLTGGAGNDTFNYVNTLDGHDLIVDFDGDAVGGQDVLDLDHLLDSLGIANGDRAGRVELTDNGGTVDVRVNADGLGGNGFELHVATLTTAHVIEIGQDVILVA